MLLATDVYTIAKSLSKEELIMLSDMLRKDINKTKVKVPKKYKLPDFTKEDSLRYVLNNLIKKT